MNEKTKKLWWLVLVIAVNLLMLILISTLTCANALCLGCNGERVAAVQRGLFKAGLYSGEISGEYDFATRNGIRRFQAKSELPINGESDYKTMAALGLGCRSGDCFSMQAELLAHLLDRDGGSYADMLANGARLLEQAEDSLTLGQYISRAFPDFFSSIPRSEPSSAALAAALQVLRSAG